MPAGNSKIHHQGAGTIPPKAVPLPPNGTITSPPSISRLPRLKQPSKLLPGAQIANADTPPKAHHTLVDTYSESLEGKEWPLISPESINERQILEPSSQPALSNIDSIAVSSYNGASDDNNVHVRRLCHSSSSTSLTDLGPVLRVSADADAVILGATNNLPPVPAIPAVIPDGSSHQRSFRDRVFKAIESTTSPSATPPSHKTCPAGCMTEMGSGTRINPIRSMKPARKLGPDNSSPRSPLSVAEHSVTTRTADQASASLSDSNLTAKASDEPTKLATSASQSKSTINQGSSSLPHTMHSQDTIRNEDSHEVRTTDTATSNGTDSSSGCETPQRRHSDHSDEQLAASLASPPSLGVIPSDKKDQSTTQKKVKAQRSIRDLFSRNKSRANLTEEPPPPLPNKQGFLGALRSKSRVNLKEEAPPIKQGFLNALRSKSRVNLKEETPPTDQGFLSAFRSKSRVNLGESPPTDQGFTNATSSWFAEAMPDPNDRFMADIPQAVGPPMPSPTPEVAGPSVSPDREPVPMRRSALLEAIDSLAREPDHAARRELHTQIAEVVKEVAELAHKAQTHEAEATQKSMNAHSDSKKAEQHAKQAEHYFKKAKLCAEAASDCAKKAHTSYENAALMANEADVARARAEMDADEATEQITHISKVLEDAGLDADSVITVQELARELFNCRNPWAE